MLPCSLAHASPRVALSGVPVCTGAHSRGGGVRVPAVFCPPAGLDLLRLGPSAPPGVGPHSSACVCVCVCVCAWVTVSTRYAQMTSQAPTNQRLLSSDW